MKQRCLLIHLVVWSLLLEIGCQKQAWAPRQLDHSASATPETTTTEAIEPETEAKDPEKQGPKITFEGVVYDFGTIGPGVKKIARFKFSNTGDGLLRITSVRKCCGVVAVLEKMEYAPGESGALIVEYRSAGSPATVRKHLYVNSNDESAPRVELTIKAKIVLRVACEPKRLTLAVRDERDEDFVCPEITLTSMDGRPFSIAEFTSTDDCITADIDRSLQATRIVLQPKIDIRKLQRNRRGRIIIGMSFGQPNAPNEKAAVAFEVLRQFSVRPAVLHVVYDKGEEPVTKKAWIVNNYSEDFEIESTSSREGYIKVLDQEKLDNGYQLSLEVTPPPVSGTGRFTDLLYVNIRGGRKLAIACRGIYRVGTRKSTEHVESNADVAELAGSG